MAQAQQNTSPQQQQDTNNERVQVDSQSKYQIQTEEYRQKYDWLDSMISPDEVIYDLQHPHIIIYMIQILSGVGLMVAGVYITYNGIPQLEQYVQVNLSWYPLLLSLVGLFVILFELYKRSQTFFVITSEKFLERRRIVSQRKNPIHWNRKANVNTRQTKTDVFLNMFLPRSNIGHIFISTAEDANPQLKYGGVKDMRKVEALIERFMSGSSGGMVTGMYDNRQQQNTGSQNSGGRNGGQYPDNNTQQQNTQPTQQNHQQNQQNRQPNQQNHQQNQQNRQPNQQNHQQNQQNRQPNQQNHQQNRSYNRPDTENYNHRNNSGGQNNGDMSVQQNTQNRPPQDTQNESGPSLFGDDDDDNSQSLFGDVDDESTDLDDEIAERYNDDNESNGDPTEPW